MTRSDMGIRGIGMTSARTRDRLIKRLIDQGIRSASVLEQIRNVPRHLFVDEALASRAYEDTALPIGMGQTISQPYVVARMSEALLDNMQAFQAGWLDVAARNLTQLVLVPNYIALPSKVWDSPAVVDAAKSDVLPYAEETRVRDYVILRRVP